MKLLNSRIPFAVCILSIVPHVLGRSATSRLRGQEDEESPNQTPSRKLEDSSSSPSPSPPLTMDWDYDFVKRGQRAVNLTHLIKADNLMEDVDIWDAYYQSFKVWDDGLNDRSMVVKDDDTCYVVFQGMNLHNPFDYFQTLNPLQRRNVFGTTCNVRRSFYNGYDTNFIDELLNATDECVNSCTDGDCPLVLAGHSAGGSSAIIASLDPRMQVYSPLTYTFAPLRAVIQDCPELDVDHIYRISAANAGIYDASADGSPKMGFHVGHLFIMDENNDFYYIGPNDQKIRMPDNYNIHIIEVYLNRFKALASRNPSRFPLTLGKFPDGHWCTEDDECQSTSCDTEAGVCASANGGADKSSIVLRAVGANCGVDNDGSMCTSGACKLGKCAKLNRKAATGSPCEAHEDCDSNKCMDGACLDQLLNGSWCKDDYECISQSCSGKLNWFIWKRKCADPSTDAPADDEPTDEP